MNLTATQVPVVEVEHELVSFEDYYVKQPLYKKIEVSIGLNYLLPAFRDTPEWIKQLFFPTSRTLDLYCPECQSSSVFKLSPADYPLHLNKAPGGANLLPALITSVAVCSRNRDHKLAFVTKVEEDGFSKIGQTPSIADLNINQIKKYRSILKDDYSELTKAIGLVSHGVGVGAFVYLRRIFENLIEEAHQKASTDSHWDEEQYTSSRMIERIRLLKHYLPEFLVETSSMYGILSKGVHELDEDECLTMFPVVLNGIEFILDEKLYQKEKEKKIAETKKTLNQYHSSL